MIKIDKTEAYKDLQGKHVVCKGKLVLIKSKDETDIQRSNVYVNSIGYTSIIISETEEIRIGDAILCDERNRKSENPIYEIRTCRAIENGWIFTNEIDGQGENPEWTSKILVLPNQFSPEQLNDILERKLKHGDEILVECDGEVITTKAHLLTGSKQWKKDLSNPVNLHVYLNKDNHVNLFPIKKGRIEYEIKGVLVTFFRDGRDGDYLKALNVAILELIAITELNNNIPLSEFCGELPKQYWKFLRTKGLLLSFSKFLEEEKK